jgi:hypothetical protein
MKITNKLIDDIFDSFLDEKNKAKINITNIKKYLKQKGYEVEEKKSKLELAKEYKNKVYRQASLEDDQFFNGDMYIYADKVDILVNMYEQAIEEIQQKSKIDDDLIECIKNWIYVNKSESSWSFLDINETISYFKKIFKQLGIKDKS